MIDSLERSRIELRRAEHLYYVSLKYTRTVDMIKNVIARLITAVEAAMDSLIMQQVEKGTIDKIPELPRQKIDIVKKEYTDPYILEMVDFYIHLRALDKATHDDLKEYRRHVTMATHTPEGDINVDIDKVGGYYQRTVWYLMHIHTVCGQDEQQVISTKHV